MGLKKEKVIKFASSHKYVPTPVPSFSNIPEWFKKIPKYGGSDSDPVIGPEGTFINRTVKHCSPFLDALTLGYVVELWHDIQIVRTMEGPEIRWTVDPKSVDARSKGAMSGFPTPPGCYPIQFVWQSPITFKTPPGYSVLVTHPLNRTDLPFICMSGVVDSDRDVIQRGNVPFYLSEDFEGIIEAGTPIFQLIPFKRDDWKSEVDQRLDEEGEKFKWLSSRSNKPFYRDNIWVKKKYQ
jgi:hypothetical protein